MHRLIATHWRGSLALAITVLALGSASTAFAGGEPTENRHAAPGAQSGVRADEREVLGGNRSLPGEAQAKRVVVLGDVLGDVVQQRRILDPGVRRDLLTNQLERRARELLTPARERGDDPRHRSGSVDGAHGRDCNPLTSTRTYPALSSRR